jgi:hypothetical protein
MIKRYRRVVVSQYLIVSIILIGGLGFGWLGMWVMARVPFTDYFVIPWAAGRAWLLEGISPYEPSVIEIALEAIEGTPLLAQLPEMQVLTQPLFSLIFYLPFSLLPYPISRVLWMTISGISVGLIGLGSLRLSGWMIPTLGKSAVVLLLLFWLPGAAMLMGGYLTPVSMVLIITAINLILNGQDTPAGLILSLTVSAFPNFGLVLIGLLFWSVSKKRWSIISGFISGLVFLLIMSWLVLPSWFINWFATLFNTFQGWEWVSTPLMNLAAFLPGIENTLSIALHGAFIVYTISLWITITGKSGRSFIYKLLFLFALNYFLHIQGALNHLLLVFPALMMVSHYTCERWGLRGRVITWGLLIIIGMGSWLLVYPNIDFTAPIGVPLLSIGMPFLVIIGMIWIRWWALTRPQLPYQVE